MSKRQEVANEITKILKSDAGLSLKEITQKVTVKTSEAQVYFILKDLIVQKMVDYSEKRGRTKLFKLVPGVDISKAELKRTAVKSIAKEAVAPITLPGQPTDGIEKIA